MSNDNKATSKEEFYFAAYKAALDRANNAKSKEEAAAIWHEAKKLLVLSMSHKANDKASA